MLKLRLSMGGTKKRPIYKIVVADSRFARDGRFRMDTLIGRRERVWVSLMVCFLCFGLFEVHGQTESVDSNKTESVSAEAASESGGSVLEVIKKVLTYPLIKMGKGNLTLQSLLILGLLFISS